ncbi:hypothetical protein D3C72_1784310 [compost metagenome]
MVGRVSGMVRSTRPTLPCCTKALTRNRPMPAGEIAKLHSLVFSNSATWRSLMIERASVSVWLGESGWLDTLVTLPSILMAGGKSAVMNKSLPLRCTISLSKSLMNLLAWSRSMVILSVCRSVSLLLLAQQRRTRSAGQGRCQGSIRAVVWRSRVDSLRANSASR